MCRLPRCRTFALIALLGMLAACQPQSAELPATAKNVILFVGDGMGVSTVTAARIFDGQSKGMSGEEHVLSFETFPNTALVKVYNTNQQVPDSAGTITAMLTGTKTRAGMLNVGPKSLRGDCDGMLSERLVPISKLAKDAGKSVGIVTTTRLTHATPAAVYAVSSERDWEDDSNIDPADQARGCNDIAYQFVHSESGPDVAMGGGSQHFFGTNRLGQRRGTDDDLVMDWLSGDANRRYVSSKDQLDALRPGQQVLGLFAASHMTYVAEKPETSAEPSLSQMATTAVRLLEANEKGYFLLIEGGRIDHGHHDGKPGYAMLEAQAFANAVGAVIENVDVEETLILVTADHSHVFTMGGYATRGNPILGYVVKNDDSGQSTGTPDLAADDQPYTTLLYASGPGAVRQMPRPRPEIGIDAVAQSLVPVQSGHEDGSDDYDETHAGEDVALYAIGPGSEVARGVMEQNLVFDVMTRAYGWNK